MLAGNDIVGCNWKEHSRCVHVLKCAMGEQVKEECGISLNVTETECLDRFSEGKDSGTEYQNGALVMDSQTEDFYRDPSFKSSPCNWKDKPKSSTIDEKAYEQQVVLGEQQVVLGEQPVVLGEQPVVLGEQPVVLGEQQVVLGEQPVVLGEQPVVLGEQPVTLNEQATLGEDMPDGWHFMEKIKDFISGESNSEILDDVGLIPINIMELITESTLYWNNGLKSMAPRDCAPNAQFKMITVDDYSDGLIVKFQSLVQKPVQKAFLCVNCKPQSQNAPPTFLLLPDSPGEQYTIKEFHLGPAGAAVHKYISFLNPCDKQWYYWMVEGDNIVARTKTEVSMHNTQIFQTLRAECM